MIAIYLLFIICYGCTGFVSGSPSSSSAPQSSQHNRLGNNLARTDDSQNSTKGYDTETFLIFCVSLFIYVCGSKGEEGRVVFHSDLAVWTIRVYIPS